MQCRGVFALKAV